MIEAAIARAIENGLKAIASAIAPEQPPGQVVRPGNLVEAIDEMASSIDTMADEIKKLRDAVIDAANALLESRGT